MSLKNVIWNSRRFNLIFCFEKKWINKKTSKIIEFKIIFLIIDPVDSKFYTFYSVSFVFEACTWPYSTFRSKALLRSDSNVPRRFWPFTVPDRFLDRSWTFHDRFWASYRSFLAFLRPFWSLFTVNCL